MGTGLSNMLQPLEDRLCSVWALVLVVVIAEETMMITIDIDQTVDHFMDLHALDVSMCLSPRLEGCRCQCLGEIGTTKRKWHNSECMNQQRAVQGVPRGAYRQVNVVNIG